MMTKSEHSYIESWVTEYGGTAILGFISTLLILGKAFHHVFNFRGLLFGMFIVPPVVISGVFGIIWFYVFLQIDRQIAVDLEGGLLATKVNLINFVFASLILGLFCSRKNSQHNGIRALITSLLHEGLPMIIYSEIVVWGQSGCCLLVLVLCNHAFHMNIPHQFATVIPLGIESGQASLYLFHGSHDTQENSEFLHKHQSYPEWSKSIVQESQTLGLIMSCLLAIIVMSCKQLFISYGWINHEVSQPSRTVRGVHGEGDAESFDRSSPMAPAGYIRPTPTLFQRPSSISSSRTGQPQHASTNNETLFKTRSNSDLSSSADHPSFPSAVDDIGFRSNHTLTMDHLRPATIFSNIASLGAHLSLIALSVFLSFGVSLACRVLEIELNWNRYVLSGVPLYKLSMVCALVCVQFSLTKTGMQFKREWFMRLCGLMLDLLVICALSTASPHTDTLQSTHYMLCGLFVVICASWNVFCFFYLAKDFFPNYWFIRAVTISGGVLGHSYMGLLLARTLDPHLLTPVPVAYAYKLMLFIIPSTAVKNSIIIKLVDDYGLLVAIFVAWLVVATWYLIFQSYFKHRFVNSSKKFDYATTSSNDSIKTGAGLVSVALLSPSASGKAFIDTTSSFPNRALSLQSSPMNVSGKGRASRSRSRDPADDSIHNQRQRKNLSLSQQQQQQQGKTNMYVRQDGLELANDDDEEAFLDGDDDKDVTRSGFNKYGVPTILSAADSDSKVNHNSSSSQTNYVEKVKLNFVHESSESSSIVTANQLHKIWTFVPMEFSDKSWFLRYSLRRDGASLQTLLSLCVTKDMYGRPEQTCSVIIIEDSWGYVFGGFIAHGLEDKQSYYGNGESFVFSLAPTAHVYPWTQDNSFFVISNANTLAMGGGSDGFAFQLDDELDTGVSNKSATYNNKQLSSSEFFKCINLEVWSIDALNVNMSI